MTTWNIDVRKTEGDVYIVKPAKGYSNSEKHAKEIDKTCLSVKGMLAEE
jgi:hypothetical protein